MSKIELLESIIDYILKRVGNFPNPSERPAGSLELRLICDDINEIWEEDPLPTMCRDENLDGWSCSRTAGHAGRHVASTGVSICAVWDDENRAVVKYVRLSEDLPGTNFVCIRHNGKHLDGFALNFDLQEGDIVVFEAQPISLPEHPGIPRVLFTNIRLVSRRSE